MISDLTTKISLECTLIVLTPSEEQYKIWLKAYNDKRKRIGKKQQKNTDNMK